MKRLLLFLIIAANALAATTMKIENGVLVNQLDANGQQIINLGSPTNGTDATSKAYVDSVIGTGPGGGGLNTITGDTGATTGLTLAITGNTNPLTDPVFTLGGMLNLANGGTGASDASTARTNIGLGFVDNTRDIEKPVSGPQQTALNLKLDATALSSYTGSTSITTLGTIGTGTWNATAISASKLPALNGITAPTADVSFNSFKITSLANPISGTDGANKQYVDAVATGGVPHQAAAAASTGNLTLSGEQTIDGVSTSGSRVLVKNQTNQTQNGIYVTASGAWTRAADADVGSEIPGSVFVSGGTVNAGTTWATTSTGITIGSTNIVYTQTGANTVYSAGTGLLLFGSQFSLAPMPPFTVKGNSFPGPANSVPQDLTMTDLKGTNMLNIANVENTKLSTWTGNTSISSIGTLTTGTVPLARVSPTPSTAGQNLFTVPNPTQNTFPRIGSGGVLTLRSMSETLGDIGGQPAFTIATGTPMTLTGSPLQLSMTQASSLNPGWLSTTDWSAFNAKVGGNRKITYTAPLRVDGVSGGSGDFSQDRTVDMPRASSTTSGYLHNNDFVSFSTGGINSTIIGGGNVTVDSPTNRLVVELVSDVVISFPNAGLYSAGKFIELVEPFGGSTTTAYKVTINRSSSDTIDGQTSIVMPRGFTYARFTSDGVTAWYQVQFYATTVRAFNDATKAFTLDASQQDGATPGPAVLGVVTAAKGQSYTYKSTIDLGLPGFLADANADGTFAKRSPVPLDTLPSEQAIGTAGVDLGSGTTDINSGVDTVRIAGNLTGPYTIRFPHPSPDYKLDQTITVIDASGTVSSSHILTVTSINGTDTFNNGASSVFIDEPNVRRSFASNGSSNWSVPTAKTSVQGFQTGTGPNLSINGSNVAVTHNVAFTLANGPNDLNVTNRYDGMEIEMYLAQPSASPAGTLNLPSVSRVGTTGNGAVLLSDSATKPGAIDKLRGKYVAALNAFMWDKPELDYTTSATPTAPTALTASTGTPASSTIHLAWTDNSTNETSWEIYRSPYPGTNFSLVATVPTASTCVSNCAAGTGARTYDDGSLSPNSAYNYNVKAKNSAGTSSPTGNSNASTSSASASADLWELHFNDNGTNGTVVTPTGTGPAGNMTKSQWVNVSGTNYAWAPTQGMPNTQNQSATPATAGTASWKYRVIAWKGGLHNFQGSDPTATNAAATVDTTNKVTISWNAVTGADSYEVCRISTTGGTSPTAFGQLIRAAPGGLITGGPTTYSYVDDGTGGGTNPNGTCSSGVQAATDVSKVTSWDTSSSVNKNITYPSTAPDNQIVTISFWAKSTWNPSPDNSSTVLRLNSLGTINVQMAGGVNRLLSINMPGVTGTMTATVPTNVDPAGTGNNVNSGTGWHLITIVLDNSTATNTPSAAGTSAGASDNIRVYFDGNHQQTLTFTTVTRALQAKSFANDIATIGSVASFPSSGGGSFDDFRLYSGALRPSTSSSGALTPTEIATLYSDGQK